jgi:FlaA1/EpsC-like NDP-sugar epimerase
MVPRTVPALNWLVLLFFIGGSRFIARWWLADVYSGLVSNTANLGCTKNVIIYGAGHAGVQLASALECGPNIAFKYI